MSLPLCRSNSRFPRESKPSLRPMPRPLPPRPPLPPPRPLIGLSLTGLKKLMQNNCYNHSLAKVLSQWGKHFYCPVGGSKNKFSPLQHNTLISGFGFYKLLRESWTANCVYCLVLSFLFAWFFCCFSFPAACCKQKLRIWKWIDQLSNDLKLPVRLHTTEWDCTYNWFFFFFLKVYKNPDSSYLKVDLQMTLFFSVSYTDFCDNKIYVPAAVWARLQSLIMVKNA